MRFQTYCHHESSINLHFSHPQRHQDYCTHADRRGTAWVQHILELSHIALQEKLDIVRDYSR
jgi:hypothetical protein